MMNKEQMNRRRFLVTAAVVGASSLFLPRVTGMALAAEPTLADTVDWLREKLEQEPEREDQVKERTTWRYGLVLIEDKTLLITAIVTLRAWLHVRDESYTTYSFYIPLDKIKPNVRFEPTANSVYFNRSASLECTGGERKIRVVWQNVKKDGTLNKEGEEMRQSLEIGVSTDELAQRVAKALSHAIKLCGGNDKPKEIF